MKKWFIAAALVAGIGLAPSLAYARHTVCFQQNNGVTNCYDKREWEHYQKQLHHYQREQARLERERGPYWQSGPNALPPPPVPPAPISTY